LFLKKIDDFLTNNVIKICDKLFYKNKKVKIKKNNVWLKNTI